jgi:hypothetical protein
MTLPSNRCNDNEPDHPHDRALSYLRAASRLLATVSGLIVALTALLSLLQR